MSRKLSLEETENWHWYNKEAPFYRVKKLITFKKFIDRFFYDRALDEQKSIFAENFISSKILADDVNL